MSHLAACFTGSSSSDAKSISKEIERQIREAKKVARGQVKLLVLGAAESGKSTFIKQMRIIHGKGYTEEEKRSFIPQIHHNVNVAMRTLASAMGNLGIKYENEDSKEIGEKFSSFTREDETPISDCDVIEIKEYWKDAGVEACYRRRNEFHLFDSASYYLNSIDRVGSSGYIPTLQDILRARLPTSGITEYLFDIDSFIFGIVDVGGQKTERRKWIHCFENVTSIIFLAALSEYDQSIPEDEINHDLRHTMGSIRHNTSSTHSSKPMVRTNSEQLHLKSRRESPSHKSKSYRNNNTLHTPLTRSETTKHLPPFPSTPNTSSSNRQHAKTSSERTRRSNSDSFTPPINRLSESCALFRTIVSDQWFKNTSVILFLNKTDVLKEKIKYSHVRTHFPEFHGADKDPAAAREFILGKFSQAFDSFKHTKRSMYAHYTCATDTSNIRFVFTAVKDIIVQSYLINYNLV